jgi:glycosyltransferase involved in cell wall biosynthesis
MNVWLVVDFEPIPGIDGASRYLRYGMLANRFASNGHDVTWWTADFDHFAKRHRAGPKQLSISPNLTIKMLTGTGYSRNISLRRIRHNRSVARSFLDAIETVPNDSQPDVVMVCLHSLELADAVTVFAHKRKIPLVVDVVDIWPEVYLRAFPQYFKGIARHALRSEFMRAMRILERAQLITAVSKSYLDWALKLCQSGAGHAGAVFPLGYDDGNVDEVAVASESARLIRVYGIAPDTINIAFVGQLSHSYDLATVIKAARLVYSQIGMQVRFFIAGDGIDRSRLEFAAKDLPIVSFTGWLSHPSVVALLRLSTGGLVSYARDATQSLPYKPFEYMAAGLVLLSSLTGEMESLIRNDGIGVQYTAGSAESLATGIVELIRDPACCAEMRKKSRSLFEAEFRSDLIYDRLMARIESLSANPTPLESLAFR